MNLRTELKNGKATGIDGVPAKILKALGCMGQHELFEICLDIYRKVTGQEISQNPLSFQ